MDSLDVRILRSVVSDRSALPLTWNLRPSFGSIAKSVGADEGTVRNRIRKLRDSGFPADWRLMVNPRLNGRSDAIAWFDVPPHVSKSELIAELRLLDGVMVIGSAFGSFLYVAFRYARVSSRLRQVELIRRLAKTDQVNLGGIPYPDCKIRLASSDWAVLESIQKDPRRSYKAVASEVGLSSQTVKRKLQRMMQGNVAFGFAAYDPKKLHGSVWALLVVSCAVEQWKELDGRLFGKFGEQIWQVTPLAPFSPDEPMFCGYNLMLANVPKSLEILGVVRQMPAVKEARLELMVEAHVLFNPLEEEVENHTRRPRAGPD